MSTYSASDPRSQAFIDRSGGRCRRTYAAKAGPSEFAAAEYVKFHDIAPSESLPGARTWYSRGQNFIVAYSEVTAETVFTRKNVDEYFVILLEEREQRHARRSRRAEGSGRLHDLDPAAGRKLGEGLTRRVGSRDLRAQRRRGGEVLECAGVCEGASEHSAVPAVARSAGRVPHSQLQSRRAAERRALRPHLALDHDDDQRAATRAGRAMSRSSRRIITMISSRVRWR